MKKAIILMAVPALLCACDLWTNEQLNQQLRSAAAAGDAARVEHLLDRRADIEAQSSDKGWTALMAASRNGETAVVELLLDRGADIEARDDKGWTALMRASARGAAAVVKLLLDRGADIETRDDDGFTALMWASGNGAAAVVKLLLDRGADIEARNDYERTAFMYASGNGAAAVVELLLNRGADIEAGDVPLPIAEEFLTGKVERLDFFRRIGRISGETSDESFFIVTPLIGYRPDDDVTLQELIQRAPQIKERIEIYFSSRSVEELQDADDRARVKRDLIEEINQMMENDIRDVVFDNYSF